MYLTQMVYLNLFFLSFYMIITIYIDMNIWT